MCTEIRYLTHSIGYTTANWCCASIPVRKLCRGVGARGCCGNRCCISSSWERCFSSCRNIGRGVMIPTGSSLIMRRWHRFPKLMPDSSRSEEHTSELQSLMRISYAVFCLKKKNMQKQQQYYKSNIKQKTQ